MTTAYSAYAVTEAFLFLFTLNIWRKLGTSIGSKAETRELKYAIYMYLVVLVTDIIWAFEEDNLIESDGPLFWIVNGIYLCAFTSVCFFWYRFTLVRLDVELPFQMPKSVHWLLMLPYALTIGSIVLSFGTDWIFYIDEEGTYVHGKLYPLFIFTCFFYGVIIILRSFTAFRHAKTAAKRRECLVCAAYVLPAMAGQIFKYVLPTAPLLHLCLYLILQILFLTMQENQIFNDALTGMNNRRKLNYYLEDKLQNASKEAPITVFMMDADSFKTINDTYGHVEGDEALISIGKALKRAAGEYNCFVARYGGDEFCMVSVGRQGQQEEIKGRIKELVALTHAADKPDAGYVLSVSVGYTTCTEPNYDMDAVVSAADEQLAKEKQKLKGKHRR